jgi:cysteinyl-tRNA synthetase
MLNLYNTLSRKKEEFHPIHREYVGLYTCGPTVYFFAHIGNLRTYIFEDILKRVLLFNNFRVKHVMNITDVGHLTSDADEGEDKMLKGAKREGKTVWEIAKYYEDAFMNDIHKLNILDPDIKCKATDHIQEMIDLIKRLEKNGITYISNGNVYYDIMKFPHYGVLARLNIEELQSGARIEVDENKRNPQDFALWFTKSKFDNQEMKWNSPWGTGYPGWHIECSAMSMKYLGEHFDIHCGGIDHIPVHHTNEIAQSEGATGHKWVNFWLHGEFLVMDKGKMSKSAGEFLTISVLQEKGYNPLDYRYLCLNTHYRTPLTFTYDSLDAAKTTFQGLKNKIIEFRKNAEKEHKDDHNMIIMEKYGADFIDAVNDDLNMPKALAVLWGVIKDKDLKDSEKLHLIFEFDKVYGLDLANVVEETIDIPEEIQEIVDERQQARKNKDFKKSDELRDLLKEKGYSVDDSKDGMKIRKIIFFG